MHPAHRFASCAVLLLMGGAPLAHAGGASYPGAIEFARSPNPLSLRLPGAARSYLDLGANRTFGFSTRLQGGWTAALSFPRNPASVTSASMAERFGGAGARGDGRPWPDGAAKRIMALSLSRRF